MNRDESDYARDSTSRALINTNKGALAEHKLKKDMLRRLEKLESEVSSSLAILNTILPKEDKDG